MAQADDYRRSLEEIARENHADTSFRRRVSTHEAGHAVWFFLDGQARNIRHIDVAFSEFTDGRVTMRLADRHTRFIDSEKGVRRRQLSANVVASCFAGPVCEHRLDCTNSRDNWDTMLDEWFGELHYRFPHDGEATHASQEQWSSDFKQAVDCTWSLYHMRRTDYRSIGPRSMNFLEQVWNWTHELFAMPEVWAVVQTLAENLAAMTEPRMQGQDACRLMQGAWHGPADVVPMHHIGRPWVTRFGTSASLFRWPDGME
jgi:hypothetical protein